MSTPIDEQLRDYFTMVDRMQGSVDIDALQQAPTLRLIPSDTDQEDTMLAPNKNEPPHRSRTLLMVAAAVAVLALIGGLIVAGTRADDDPVPAVEPDLPTDVDPVPEDELEPVPEPEPEPEPEPDPGADAPPDEWVVEVDPAAVLPQFVMSGRIEQSGDVSSESMVERGDDVLGCSALSYVSEGVGSTSERRYTCESGERVGTFTVQFRPQGFTNADFLGLWVVVGATGDFVGLQGGGVFFLDIHDVDNDAGENFVTQIEYVSADAAG